MKDGHWPEAKASLILYIIDYNFTLMKSVKMAKGDKNIEGELLVCLFLICYTVQHVHLQEARFQICFQKACT